MMSSGSSVVYSGQVSSFHMDGKEIESAVREFKETGSLHPMVKVELKLKVKLRRLAEGKEDLPDPVFKEPEKYPLTEEEERKREVRRTRNRVAAQKCRAKKKTAVESLEEERKELKLRKQKLNKMVTDLESEKERVIRQLNVRNIAWEAKLADLKTTENGSDIQQGKAAFEVIDRSPQSACPPPPLDTRPPPPPYDLSALSPLQFQDQIRINNNSGSLCTSATPPPSVFTPLDSSTARDFDPLFTYTSPQFSHSFNRHPSCTSTASYTEMLDEPLSPCLHGSTDGSVYEPLPLAQTDALTYPHTFDLPALPPSNDSFQDESSLFTTIPAISSKSPSFYTAVPTLPSESPSLHTSPPESTSFSSELQLPQSGFLNQMATGESVSSELTSAAVNLIPSTVFEFLEKDSSSGNKHECTGEENTTTPLGFDEAQVPGNYLTIDDEIISSQELLTLYD